MGRTAMWLCGACIIFVSIGLNIFLVTYHYASVEKLKQQKLKLSWSEAAAAEAEAVASIDCSGHGRAYLDGLRDDDDKPVCECNTCYGGPNCSIFLTDCAADANSGDPKFLEPYWERNAAKSAVVISGWHRMSYGFADGSYISQQLTDHIRQLHAKAKNAVAHDKYIVFGVGSLQLLSAAVFALSINRTSPATVLAAPPYYPLFRSQTNYFETARFKFNVSILTNNSYDGEDAIEFVTIPTNPDGFLKDAVLNGSNVKHIYDYACYWPHYTAIPAPADEDLMLFSLSKFTGHAGTRLGWALVRDKGIYDNMVNYISLAESGTSREAQLRSLQLLKTIIHSNDTSSQIFDYAFNTLRQRWLIITQIFSSSTRFQIQDVPDQYCNYFGRVRGASPAYAWVKCVRKEESSCWEVMNVAKIVGRAGRDFDADDSYVRLSLIKREDDFNQVATRLKDLIAKENGAPSNMLRSSI